MKVVYVSDHIENIEREKNAIHPSIHVATLW